MTSDQLRPSEREPITGHPIVCPECRQELSLFAAGYCGNEGCELYDAQPWPDYANRQDELAFYDPCQTCCPFGAGQCQGHLIAAYETAEGEK